jgi:hypothetical protein
MKYEKKSQSNREETADIARILKGMVKDKLEISGDTDDSFVIGLRSLKDRFKIANNASVIYPGSSTHVGVARVFGKANVVHVDPELEAVKTLKEAGYKAEALGIEDYRPDSLADIMVALNSYGSPTEEIVERLVKPGGYVIANNYTQWANKLNLLESAVKLKAVLGPSFNSDDARIVDAIELPDDVSAINTTYYNMGPGGALIEGTLEDHNFAAEIPLYPDALFVFERL